MQPFHHSPASGDRPLWIYYAGFALAIAATFYVIFLLVRQQRLELTDEAIALGPLRCSRLAATFVVRPWKRMFGNGAILEIRTPDQVWRVGAPTRAVASGHRERSAMPAWKIDLLVTALDFDEVLARLSLPDAPPHLPGVRLDLLPFRRSARGALAIMKPWFVTILILAVLGPTLGPVVAGMRYGTAIMTPVVLFAALAGVIAVMGAFHRPAKLMRLVLGSDQAAAIDVRSGATLAAGPTRGVRADRFHFLLMGGRSEAMSFRNRGLELSFPDGFSVAIALPAFSGWSERVRRGRAPRWTVDPAGAEQLSRIFSVR